MCLVGVLNAYGEIMVGLPTKSAFFTPLTISWTLKVKCFTLGDNDEWIIKLNLGKFNFSKHFFTCFLACS